MQDLRQALESSGDITIGAYARRTRRRRMLIGLLGVVLILGAFGVYLLVVNMQSTPAPVVTLTLRCKQCGTEMTLEDNPQRSYPTACQACEAQAVWPIWQCRYCEHKFLPVGSGESGAEVRCPMCDSTDVGHPHQE